MNSDDFLIQAVIQLKLRKTPYKENIRQRRNIQQLKLSAIRRTFNLELKNRFSALDNFDEDNISNQYELIKETYLNTAKDTLGFQTKNNKEWMSEDTWKKIEERNEIKQKILNSRSTRLQKQLQSSYKIKDKEFKRNARKDRREFIDAMAREAEKAANRGEMRTLCKPTMWYNKSTKYPG